MLVARDYEGVEYPLVASVKHKSELNGTDDLEVTIHAQINKHIDIKQIDKLWEIDFQNVTYKIMHTKQQTKGDGFYLTVRAMPLFYWDFDKSIIHTTHNGSHTANSAFSIVFGGSGYNFVLVDFSPAVSWEGFGGGSTRLELFKRLLERYNYEFTIQGKTVYMHHQIGNDTNYVYKYGLNASNVSQSTDAASMFTHIKGFGDFEDREDYYEQANLRLQYTSPLAQLLGSYEGKPIVDGRITNTETMQNAMQKAVEDSLVISVEGNLHDVRKMGYDIAVPLKGDRVWLQDDRLDLETEIRLHTITTTYDVRGEIIGCDVVFGSQTAGERHKAQINTLSKNFSDLLEGNLKLPIISLEQVGRDMIEAIHDASSEITFGDYGMRAISKDNPNHVFGVNSEGWYISQDGGATPRTIATAEGIYADALFAGTLWLTNEMNIESADGYLNVTGSNFIMQSKNNPHNAVEINPDTGITIRGFDGREMMVNGIMQGAVVANVQRFASHLLEVNDRNIILSSVEGMEDNFLNLSDTDEGVLVDGVLRENLFKRGMENEGGAVSTGTGLIIPSNNYYTDFIRLKPNTQYRIRSIYNGSVYDSNQEFVRFAVSGGVTRITTNSNEVYIRFTITPENLDNATFTESHAVVTVNPNDYVTSKSLSFPSSTSTTIQASSRWYLAYYSSSGAVLSTHTGTSNQSITSPQNTASIRVSYLHNNPPSIGLASEDGDWQRLYVLHDQFKGRYLDLWYVSRVISTSPSETAYVNVRVIPVGGSTPIYTERMQVRKGSEDEGAHFRPRMDLQSFYNSIVDYRNFSYYIEVFVETDNPSDRVTFRLNTAYFND